MYKKRKKTRRYDKGGIPNDDKFTRQDSVDVYDYRKTLDFFDGLDPAHIADAAERLSMGGTKYSKLWQKMENIKKLHEKMGDLGDFTPKKKGGVVGKSKGNRDAFTQQYD